MKGEFFQEFIGFLTILSGGIIVISGVFVTGLLIDYLGNTNIGDFLMIVIFAIGMGLSIGIGAILLRNGLRRLK